MNMIYKVQDSILRHGSNYHEDYIKPIVQKSVRTGFTPETEVLRDWLGIVEVVVMFFPSLPARMSSLRRWKASIFGIPV